MKKGKLSYIIDLIVTYAILLLVIFVWCNFFLKDAISSCALSVSTCFIIFAISLKKKQTKYANLKKEQKTRQFKNNVQNVFLLNTNQENLNFFSELFKTIYNIKNKSDFLLLTKENLTIAFFALYEKKQIEDYDVLECFKKCKNYNITRCVISCSTFSTESLNFASFLAPKTLIANFEQTFDEILCKYNTFPKITESEKIKDRITLKFIFHNAINRKKAKTYFIGGIVMFFSSFFVIYNTFYVVFSGILFFLCLLCLIPQKNTPKKEEII